ncbi:MAG TPA: polysaccharide biosynthesis tyrosine autokinase [Terriglobia bacterium]|nr:polysaccharide biosynthesis tyrosine autokinase [Terriglobia bacterium]
MAENENLGPIKQRAPLQRREDVPDSVIEVLPAEVDAFSSLRAYWDILSRRRWEVLTVAFVVLTIVAIYTFKMKPVYLATAELEIDSESPLIQSLKDLSENLPTDEAYLQTQVKVLQSDNLAWQTIQQLGLAQNPAFAPDASKPSSRSVEPRILRGKLMSAFSSAVSVTLVRNTQILQVSFESTDPDLAARVANTLVNKYKEYDFHQKYDATRQASGWMEQQLDEVKAKVEKSQEALVQYERTNSIVNVSDKQSVVEQRLSDLSRDLSSAQSDRQQKEALYEMVKANPDQVALLAQNDILSKLEEKYADLKSQYVDALGQYGTNFPKVVRLRDQVNEIQSLIDRERKRTVERIQNDYHAAVGREKLVSASVAEQKAEVGKINQLLIEHNMLEREFDTNQQLYQNLLQKLKDATVSAGLKATNIHVVDAAVPPSLPVRPKKTINLLLGLVVGLLLGVSLAVVLEGLEHSSIKTAEDVERLLPATCLALIPMAGTSAARYGYGLAKRGTPSPVQGGRLGLTVLKDPTSPVAESYRALRSAILFSTAPQPPRSMVVTSAQPHEGKTSTSINVAAVLAQNGARVLIIDADLRNPGVARALGVTNRKGLSGVLTGAYGIDEAIERVESTSSLWVLTAGPHPPNPAELLSSSKMETLMAELRQRFDHVVVDSPPVLLVTDATILSTLVDGVVLVAESGVTPPGALVRAHRTLGIAGGRVLGVVVNKVDSRKGGYYYGYYTKYYGAYYGSSEKERASVKVD